MEQTTGTQVYNCSNSFTSPHTSHRSTHIVLDKTKKIPRARDIWKPHFARSLDHFTRFLMPIIEVLLQVGDKILKVEVSSLSSRLVCWTLWQNVEFQQSWQLDNSNEQTFSPLLIVFQDLVPMIEGE